MSSVFLIEPTSAKSYPVKRYDLVVDVTWCLTFAEAFQKISSPKEIQRLTDSHSLLSDAAEELMSTRLGWTGVIRYRTLEHWVLTRKIEYLRYWAWYGDGKLVTSYSPVSPFLVGGTKDWHFLARKKRILGIEIVQCGMELMVLKDRKSKMKHAWLLHWWWLCILTSHYLCACWPKIQTDHGAWQLQAMPWNVRVAYFDVPPPHFHPRMIE